MISEDLRSALGARGCPQYGAPGCVASSPAAVRLAEVVGGSLLKRTCATSFTSRCWYVQWVHIGMQGAGVCIRKISGFVKVTSRSSPTKVRSQIFYVRTSQRFERPNRGFQLPPCPGALSVSALRAGALALAPTCTVLRARRGPGLTWHPARALAPIWGDRGAFGPLFC